MDIVSPWDTDQRLPVAVPEPLCRRGTELGQPFPTCLAPDATPTWHCSRKEMNRRAHSLNGNGTVQGDKPDASVKAELRSRVTALLTSRGVPENVAPSRLDLLLLKSGGWAKLAPRVSAQAADQAVWDALKKVANDVKVQLVQPNEWHASLKTQHAAKGSDPLFDADPWGPQARGARSTSTLTKRPPGLSSSSRPVHPLPPVQVSLRPEDWVDEANQPIPLVTMEQLKAGGKSLRGLCLITPEEAQEELGKSSDPWTLEPLALLVSAPSFPCGYPCDSVTCVAIDAAGTLQRVTGTLVQLGGPKISQIKRKSVPLKCDGSVELVMEAHQAHMLSETWDELRKAPVKTLMGLCVTTALQTKDSDSVEIYNRKWAPETNPTLFRVTVRCSPPQAIALLAASGQDGCFIRRRSSEEHCMEPVIWLPRDCAVADALRKAGRHEKSLGVTTHKGRLGIRALPQDYAAVKQALCPEAPHCEGWDIVPQKRWTVRNLPRGCTRDAVQTALSAWGWNVRILGSMVRGVERECLVTAAGDPPDMVAPFESGVAVIRLESQLTGGKGRGKGNVLPRATPPWAPATAAAMDIDGEPQLSFSDKLDKRLTELVGEAVRKQSDLVQKSVLEIEKKTEALSSTVAALDLGHKSLTKDVQALAAHTDGLRATLAEGFFEQQKNQAEFQHALQTRLEEMQRCFMAKRTEADTTPRSDATPRDAKMTRRD